MKSEHAAQAADDIIEKGWAIAQVSDGVCPIETMNTAWRFFDTCSANGNGDKFRTARPGEDEPDVGLLISSSNDRSHAGRAKDDKAHFMYSRDAQLLLSLQEAVSMTVDPEVERFLRLISMKHEENLRIGRMVLAELDECFGETKLVEAFDFAHAGNWCYATSATRAMKYFKKGGKTHFDRCALTVHCGDIGGELFGICPNTGERVNISPPPGYVTIFPSVKTEIATQGVLKAIEHGSISDEATARLALVTFIQMVSSPVVTDNELAIQYGLENHRIKTIDS